MKLPGNRDKKIIDGTHRIVFYLLPLLGLAFLLWYIKNAACDVVYSDYIRLVNSYLPDVFNPEKFFVADVLTRIPINYLSRIINVKFFGFSITFDRVLGAVSVSLAAWCFAAYSRQLKINIKWFITFMIVMFSLNKWEMLTNGSGWSHFFAFACFYYHQILFDRYYRGQERKWDKTILMLLPWLIILGTAGPYCAIYAVVMILASGAAAFMDTGEKRKQYVIFLICTLIPLLLYILSNSFAVEEHAGATGRSLGEILKDFPTFPIRFILKSLAGMMVGGEELQQWIANGCISNKIIYLLGVILMVGYLWSLWLNISLGIYKKTFFPLILLVSGGANHLLIFLSRYIFEKEDYALSSRYALQFQVGVLGILLTFALASQIRRKRINGGLLKRAVPVLETVFCIAILIGNGYTTYREIQKAPYREENFEKMAEMAPQIPFMSDQELKEHSKGHNDFEIRQIELPAQTVYCQDLHSTELEDKKEQLRGVFIKAIRQYGSDTTQHMFFTEYNLSNPGDFTCCIAVPPESLGEHLVTLPCQKALCIFYHGAYEGLPVIVKHLCAYANKYQIPLKGTARHLYLEGPPQHKNPENFLTQVAVLMADDTL